MRRHGPFLAFGVSRCALPRNLTWQCAATAGADQRNAVIERNNEGEVRTVNGSVAHSDA
jgi:hypothetical protein